MRQDNVKNTKVKSMVSPIRIAILLLFVWLCPLGPLSVEASAMDYAVQVAALRSQQNAADLAKGLRAQGLNAYWVGKNVAQQGVFYRVRIGKFASIESAYLYAEELMDSGLFTTYAIAAYEAPPAAVLRALAKDDPKTDKVQAFFPAMDSLGTTAATVVPAPAPTSNASRFEPTMIEMVAAIGTRGWLLLSTQDLQSLVQRNTRGLDREVARLAATIGSRGWMFRDNMARFFAAPPAAAPVDIADLATSARPAPEPETAAPALRASPSAAFEAPRGPLSSSGPAEPGAPTPTFPGARPLNYLSPPKLQGSIELRNGQLWMTVRNLDAARSFTGSARITLTSEKDQQDLTPMGVTIAPGQEESFQVTDARVLDGDWMLMVYDQGGAARLVRGASLAPKPAAPAAEQNAPAQQPATPPGFVTGMYDATGGWKLTDAIVPQAPVSNEGQAYSPPIGNTGPAAAGADGAQAIEGGPVNPAPQAGGQQASQSGGPAQVTVTPRQIAITPENVTMEFEIAASRPLNYIAITIRAGEYQDTRQALMTTPQGRVPFLIPVTQTSGPFAFELKDESGAVLASGAGDFRQLPR
jgi:hypothetical protein